MTPAAVWLRPERKERSMNRQLALPRLAATVTILLAMVLFPNKGSAAEQAIQPLPPDGTAYGMRMPDWAVAYLQWLFSIPVDSSPFLAFDTMGERAGVGQRAPVWFVPAYPVPGSGIRTVTIPDGQAVLVSPAVILRTEPPGTVLEDELLDFSDQPPYLERIQVLEVSLDGALVPDIQRHRLKTPVFSISLAPGNLFEVPVTAGKEARVAAAAEGYWFLYPPLPPGKHVLSIRQEGVTPDTGEPYKSEWTYNLTVCKPNEPLQ
jgi:hypothetical protein